MQVNTFAWHQHKTSYTRVTPRITMIFTVGLLFFLFPSHANTESDTGTAEGVVTLAATGTASVTINPRSDILAGNYAGGFSLATWQAEVTEGTLAFRLNPSVVNPLPTTPTPLNGIIWNVPRTHYIEIEMTHNCTSPTLSGGWRVCQPGTTQASGSLVTPSGKKQTLVGGTYPVAVDAVVWTF